MAAVRFIVQTERGDTLGRFESMLEVEQYILPRQLRVVNRQRYARAPSLVSYVLDHEEYPSEMLEIEYDEIIIVHDPQEAYQRIIGCDISGYERLVIGRWDWSIYPDEKAKSNKEETEKAHKLLLECLNEKEREELESFETVTIDTEIGLFRVIMNSLNDRIPPSFNAIYKGEKYCVVIEDSIKYPRADHFVAQILLIRTNPKKFLTLANKK